MDDPRKIIPLFIDEQEWNILITLLTGCTVAVRLALVACRVDCWLLVPAHLCTKTLLRSTILRFR